MYELMQVSECAYYINCPSKIGVVDIGDGAVVAIDSGSDKDTGKKVLRTIEAKGWRLKGIFNTHSHADHIGGNRFLQEKTDCAVFAPSIECDMTNHPILEPITLYGGYPIGELRHKFLLAQESCARPLCDEVLPSGLQILPLPGHSFDMVGYRTADDVVYLADCLSSEETLDKYGIGYLFDVRAYLQTLEMVKTMKAAYFVPSHAAATEEIAPLAQYNIDAVQAIGDTIVKCCRNPVTFEILLQMLFEEYRLTMTLQQYALVGSTVRSYLSWLYHEGRVEYRFENHQMLWQSV